MSVSKIIKSNKSISKVSTCFTETIWNHREIIENVSFTKLMITEIERIASSTRLSNTHTQNNNNNKKNKRKTKKQRLK